MGAAPLWARAHRLPMAASGASASIAHSYLRKPQAPREPTLPGSPVPRAVRAKYVNHVWMMDFTPAKGLFGLQQFVIAAVVDVHSRFRLAVRVFDREPSAAQAIELIETTLRVHGRPRHGIQRPALSGQPQGTQDPAALRCCRPARLHRHHRALLSRAQRRGGFADLEMPQARGP